MTFVDGQRIGQAFDFFEGQEPVTGDLGPTAEAEGRIVGAHFPEHGQIEHLPQHLARSVGAHWRGLRRGQLLSPLLGRFLLRWPRPPGGDLGQQAINVGGRDVGHFAVLPFWQDQLFQHALLVRGVGLGYPVTLVPITASEFTAKHREKLDALDDQTRGRLRQVAVASMLEVMRDCDDPDTRAEAYGVLQALGVVRP